MKKWGANSASWRNNRSLRMLTFAADPANWD
jgi:hypothetical protein